MTMKHLAAFLILATAPLCHADTLQSATVTRVVNEVNIYKPGSSAQPAKPGSSVRGQTSVQTGANSRSELRFQDATITRLGANTVFSFQQGTRDLQLQQGTLLLQVPKNAGGARIRTSTVTAAITGTTILMEFLQNKWIKIIVLEGKLDVFLNAIGRRVTINEGQMLFMKDNGQGIPNPVDVDLARLTRSSRLVTMAPLPPNAQGAIDRRIVIQTDEKKDGTLVGANVVPRTRGDQALQDQRNVRDIRDKLRDNGDYNIPTDNLSNGQ